MKKLFLTGLLAIAALTSAKAEVPCITNCVINCTNDARMMISGPTNYNPLLTYTNASGIDLIGSGGLHGCDDGTVITFTTVGCNPNPIDVATVSYDCSGLGCGGQDGGGCSPGNKSFTITMPAYCGYYSVRIYSRFGCCTLTTCVLFQNICGPEQ